MSSSCSEAWTGADFTWRTQQRAEEKTVFEGDRLGLLVKTLDEIEDAMQILERRGLNVATMIGRMKDGKIPMHKVTFGNAEHWFFKAEEVDAFRNDQIAKGHQLVVTTGEAPATGGLSSPDAFSEIELHEIHAVNRGMEKLKAEFKLLPSDLIPQPRLAGREPFQRFFLENDGKEMSLLHLRLLVAEIRKAGERGIKIVRFKGLGEMNGEELWDTTLDPERRTLLQVQLDDALKADEMFRILMEKRSSQDVTSFKSTHWK